MVQVLPNGDVMPNDRSLLSLYILCLTTFAGCGPGDKSSSTDEDTASPTSDASTDASTDAPTSSATCTDEQPKIRVSNETSLPLAGLRYAPCDAPTESETFPFPGGQLGEGASIAVSMPGPGCYLLGIVESSGCYVDPKVQTDMLELCDEFEFAVTWELLVCPGVVGGVSE